MLNIQTLSILAIAGSAAALPQWPTWGRYFSGNRGDGSDAAATALEIVTAYTTVTWDGNYDGNYGGRGRHSHSASASAAAQTSVAAYTPPPQAPAAPQAPASSAAPAAPSPAAPASSSAAAATPSAAPVASTNDGSYMSIVNEWRGKMGMSSLTQSDTLQANALKTCQDGNGQMVHELNPGSFAQVLAPGSADEFEKVFVGGWLCERPNLPGLNGICDTMSQGWAYDGQTGHADILSSTAYSKIGCALANGIWGCDLA